MAQLLGNVTVGSIVKLNENGSPVDYLVVHQGLPSSMYDSSCNGTWLLRKDIYITMAWDSQNNDYENSDIHSYLNGTFLNLFDDDIKNAIKQVKIPYKNGTGSGGSVASGANGLSSKIFLLSVYELGWTISDNALFPGDGAKLSYFSSGTGSAANNKRIANYNSKAAYWWLRSSPTNQINMVWVVRPDGGSNNFGCGDFSGVRPAMIMPTDLLVLDDGSVSAISVPTLTTPTTAVQTQPISLSWSSVSVATSYQLQRNISSSWETIYTGPNISYEDTAGNWSSVQYQVCAIKNTDYGAYSDPQTVTILPPSAVPTINSISTVNLTESFTITWNSAANADSYVLQRNIGSGWEEVYSGANLQYQDQALYSNMSYRVASVITDLYQSTWSSEYTVDINGQMIEINVKNADGSYETIYPKTLIGNVVGIGDQYFTKQESLQSSVAQLIGLTNQAVPNDMFNILAHAGDLHVWKRTQSGAIDYPVSVNKNAYQEGSDAKPAGYTLGDVQSGKFILTNKLNPSQYTRFKQGEYMVSEDGTLSLPSENSIDFLGYESELANVQKLLGKKTILAAQSVGSFTVNAAYYFPEDAVITHGGGSGNQGYWTINKYQTVTGYPAIPANTTIEYMGQLGDKAHIVSGSYVGTGTYGENNPTEIKFPLSPKVFMFTQEVLRSSSILSLVPPLISTITSYRSYAPGSNWPLNAIWGETSLKLWSNESTGQAQFNQLGQIYYYFAIM